jgi:hypothetical protein
MDELRPPLRSPGPPEAPHPVLDRLRALKQQDAHLTERRRAEIEARRLWYEEVDLLLATIADWLTPAVQGGLLRISHHKGDAEDGHEYPVLDIKPPLSLSLRLKPSGLDEPRVIVVQDMHGIVSQIVRDQDGVWRLERPRLVFWKRRIPLNADTLLDEIGRLSG